MVEGEDDNRFFERILKPKLREKYDWVQTIRYAKMKKGKINNYLRTFKGMKADYICVTDINNSPCVTAKKQKIQKELSKKIENDKVIVVIKEIESWYLAGLSEDASRNLKIRTYNNTNNITKEQFKKLIPRQFRPRRNFMMEILQNFSIEIAKRKNRSFKYFIEKYCCKTSRNPGNSV